MLADIQSPRANGRFIADDIESNTSIKTVVGFIEVQFVAFSTTMTSDKNITRKTSEDALVGKLCIFLNRKARIGAYPFFFHHQQMEDYNNGASPKPDIGTISESEEIIIKDKSYSLDDSFFSIEAKRLPNPKKAREKEYVIGSDRPCGGIERFKKNIHGTNLYTAAIVAFIQKDNFDYWFSKVNSWINELIVNDGSLWNDSDKLTKLYMNNNLAKFNSISYRPNNKNNEHINLIHFWLKVVDIK